MGKLVNQLSLPSLGSRFFFCASPQGLFRLRQVWNCHSGQVLMSGSAKYIQWNKIKYIVLGQVIFRHPR